MLIAPGSPDFFVAEASEFSDSADLAESTEGRDGTLSVDFSSLAADSIFPAGSFCPSHAIDEFPSDSSVMLVSSGVGSNCHASSPVTVE